MEDNKNEKALQILQEYTKTKIDKFSRAGFRDNEREFKFGGFADNEDFKNNIGPFTEEEAFRHRPLPYDADKVLSGGKFINPKLYNKRFSIGDFEITVTYKKEGKLRPEYSYYKDGKYASGGYRDMHHETKTEFGVYVSYHGHYKTLMRAFDTYLIEAALCKPTQTNWHWLKPTEDKPYIMRKVTFRAAHDTKISFIEELFNSLDIDALELKDAIIQPQYQYDFTLSDDEKRPEVKNISQFTKEEIDLEWFVKQEIKDGIYRPEGSTIAKWIYDGFRAGNYDKKLLQKLGVHTIQLRADAHFNPTWYYDLKGIAIKAPKTVIERYGLEKYCKSQEVVEKIKQEKKKREDERKARDYNSKFTLMQHGKVIKKDVYYSQIIDYLENFVPASTISKSGSSKSDVVEEILKSVQIIFDEYKDLNKIYLGYWGTYCKYELRGKRRDFESDCDYLNREIDPETYSQIMQLYSNELYGGVDETAIVNKFGWPDRGFLAIGIKRVGDKLEVFTEDYDLE